MDCSNGVVIRYRWTHNTSDFALYSLSQLKKNRRIQATTPAKMLSSNTPSFRISRRGLFALSRDYYLTSCLAADSKWLNCPERATYRMPRRQRIKRVLMASNIIWSIFARIIEFLRYIWSQLKKISPRFPHDLAAQNSPRRATPL